MYLQDGSGRLAMHQVPIDERILQQGRNGVDVVLAHLPNVLKQEGECLQHPVLHVELRYLHIQ